MFIGISDVMRSDFQFMKEMASYTHVDASSRYKSSSTICHMILISMSKKGDKQIYLCVTLNCLIIRNH